MLKQGLRSKLFYNTLGSVYDYVILSTGYRRALVKFLRGFELPVDRKLRILDAGCGTGLVSFALLSKYKNLEITAFDYSLNMLRAAERFKRKNNLNVEFYWGNIESINPLKSFDGQDRYLEENSFDYIFVSGALEYVDMNRGVSELTKYLKDSGIFVNIAVRDNLCGKLIGKLMGFRPYTKEQLIESLKEARLEKIKEIQIQEKRARICKIVVSGVK